MKKTFVVLACLIMLAPALATAEEVATGPSVPPAETAVAPPAAESAAAQRTVTTTTVTTTTTTTEPIAAAAATSTPALDSGNTAWMLAATALVLLMTIPGLALFYGGMVRKKNVLATMMQSFAITALVTVLWMVVGYSLSFSAGTGLEFADELTLSRALEGRREM